jgi:hypothetical protein
LSFESAHSMFFVLDIIAVPTLFPGIFDFQNIYDAHCIRCGATTDSTWN